MPIEEIHLNDIGTVIRVTLYDGSSVVDVSNASTLQLLFKKPDNTLLTKTAVLTGDGTDGQVQYITVAGDLNVMGKWAVQARIVDISSNEWKSSVSTFRVHDNL